MSNLLTAAEAFAALQKGKTVLCRYAGNGVLKADKSFSTLDQMPATVFGQPHYEFCIQVEKTVLAEIQFTKPVEPHDLEDGQVIYIVMPSHILRTTYSSDNGEICLSVANGFAQLDEENAKLQLQAIGKTFGNIITEIEVKDEVNDRPKKTRGKRVPHVKAEEPQVKEKNSEVISAETQPAIVITEQTNVTTSEDLLVPETNEHKVDPEYQKALDALLQRVKESKTPEEVNAVYRYTRTWNDKQMEPLLLATHKRLEELEKSKAPANEPPSLMVQIQTAPDLTTLDALEIDVAARDPLIQPKLMGYIRKRRFELENPTPTQPEPTPDYLLVDGF
ncbi:hypothetical protein OW684_11615 [Acinetobacter baumannii]|uniref:hypothetical protein n=1 Tax=Acinetobacter baumannii TaxID=470 RepID=UPI00233EB06E|nr:hypothetical protein [Acinetobacter baumannii]MDC4551833.1 hypothetical protein [Acinetobacter baumannii]MDC5075119.1 hypothetical protein [Acinetobacter baumannii]MDC5201693.1 hypothetical protein [Acinetobacter baumannii]MDC5307611.1 hypothetical protein [Acinetobacter baumannii]MDC5371985.1 hypothetical protein [Acinetobacter baumannii]